MIARVLRDPRHLTAFAAFLMALGLLLTARPAPAGESVRASIEDVLARQVEAWNAGDLEAFCRHYTRDATFLSPSGLVRGRDRVLERYRRRYPDDASRGRMSLEILEVRPAPGPVARNAPPHAASVVARWTLAQDGGASATGLTLLVLHRHGSSWRIAQDASF